MADKTSKVAGVAAAVKSAKKARPKKKPVRRKSPKAAAPRKKKGATAAKKTPKKTQAAPVSGQSGPPIELSVEGLNSKEGKVFAALNGPGSGVRTVLTITELSETCFKSRGKKQANSWTRNSLRRLVQAGLVEKVDRGRYRVSDAGRKKLARAA